MFRIVPEGKTFSEYALLRSGESVLLRVAKPDDVPAVEALMRGVSRESLQMRFMGAVSYVARSTVEFMCSGEPHDRLSLLAIVGQGPDSRVMAIGTYTSLGVGGKAEVAFLVHDEFQGRGISTLLLERLAGIAAGYGFIGFEAEVLHENQAMIDVFTGSGFEVCQAEGGGGCIHVQFPVSGLASLRERVELRDRIAAANSLVPLLKPRAVAVVGASREPAAVGSMVFRAILRGGFTGAVYPVNNQTASVQSVRAHPSLADLPERADLVVVAVPAAKVLEVAEEALRAGAKALLVLTSGFAETGSDGAARQRELVNLVRSHGARLVGPNCLGVMNTHPETRLNASLAPELVPQGRIGFFSHSAALGLVILSYAAERGLGFSTFVSAGNRADVSGNDLLQYWEEDASTDLALLYLETFGNPRRFARVARRLSYRKPILCVKSARSRAGRAAARAHIDAAGMSDTNVDVLFRQAGVIRAETLEEMFDVSLLLANQPLPRGNRVAIISNSGGVLTICADACDANGLSVDGTGAVDLGALATVEEYENAVQAAVEHDDVDALVVIFACIGGCDPKVVGRGIRRGVLRGERRTGVAKPVLLCLMGQAGLVRLHGDGAADPAGASRHVFPSYRFPESAALALSRAVQYAAYRRRPAGKVLWYDDVDAGAARRDVTALLAEATEEVVSLEGERAWALLSLFGVSTGAAREGGASAAAENALVEVVSDPSFGPLVRLSKPGRPPVARITPLTDHDVTEMVETAGIPPECGVDELLGRISQLIEELPWLQAMQAEIHRVEHGPGSCGVVLEASVRIAFSRRENPMKERTAEEAGA